MIHDTDSPSDEHLLLARILERQRSDRARRAVDDVLASGVTVREMLSEISDIDHRYAESSSETASSDHDDGPDRPDPTGRIRKLDRKSGTAEDEAVAARYAALTAVGQQLYTPPRREIRRDVARNRARIKAAPVVTTFWDYLFRQRRRIREFQRQTGFLRFSFLGLTVRVNPDARTRLEDWIRTEIPPLLDALRRILNDGWIVLSKLEYNALVLLHDLVLVLHDKGVPADRPGSGNASVRFGVIERDLLVLHSVDRDGALLTGALDRFLAIHKRDGTHDVRRLSATIRTLLDEEQSPYGMAGYIRAVHIAATGRFVVLSDIMVSGADETIPSEYFDCNADVGVLIKEYLETIVTRIHRISSRLGELSRVELYARTASEEDDGMPDRVWRFAQSVAPVDMKIASEPNMLVRATHLMEATRREISPILDGVTPLLGGGGVTIFTEQCFGAEVSRIHRILHDLEKIRYDLPSFPVDRFFKVHRKADEPSTRERQAVDAIQEYAELMVRIGKRLTSFAGNRREAAGSAETQLMPYTQVAFMKGFVAPEIEQLVGGQSIFTGGAILDAITEITAISFLIGRVFEEKTILSDLREAGAHRNELTGLMMTLQRIATHEVYTAVRETDLVIAAGTAPSPDQVRE